MTRREFCRGAAAVAVGAFLPGCLTTGGRRWYRGALHTHTYWSDGRGFPEDCVAAYKALGYHFVAITDHNRIGTDADTWREVFPTDGGWPPKVSEVVANHYLRTYPHAKVRIGKNGLREVRLQPIDETIRLFDEPGRFLVMKGVEVTRSMPGKNRHDVHMNYLNVPEVLPDVARDPLVSNRPNVPVREMLSRDYAAYRQLLEKHGHPPSLFMLNHPHWPIAEVTPEDLLTNPEVRFFEVCNDGAQFAAPKSVEDDGWWNDRLWDAVNAVRARRGEALLYATASDDTHYYPGNGHACQAGSSATPDNGWVAVRAEALTPEALFAAMDRGDFYASCGVELDDVSFADDTLTVSVPAKAGVTPSIRFIVSKRNFSEKPVRTLEFTVSGRSRTLAVYGPEVGQTAKCVTGRVGKSLVASYTLAADDLYVRARVETDEKARLQVPFHVKVPCAWTQPYR